MMALQDIEGPTIWLLIIIILDAAVISSRFAHVSMISVSCFLGFRCQITSGSDFVYGVNNVTLNFSIFVLCFWVSL